MTPETILLRQIHPNFIPDGELSSQAFMPFPKDDGKPSVYDSDKITPSESYQHYTEVLGFESNSVWGLTCGEVSSVGVVSVPDPKVDFDSHAVIDFTRHPDFNEKPDKCSRKLAKKLKAFALARGCLYSPDNG